MCAFLLVDGHVFVKATIVFVDVAGCRIASKQEISYFRDASLENATSTFVLCRTYMYVYAHYKFHDRDAYLYGFPFYDFNK